MHRGFHRLPALRRASTQHQKSITMPLSLRIGMFGAGTVGGGVYEIVEQTKKIIFKASGLDITIVKICVKNAKKPRSFVVEDHTKLVTDYNEILEDDSINCVIELMGGVTHAKDVVFQALRKGKHVITANKALLAQFLPEVKALIAENARTTLGYEAAVCGGIPIIHNMQGSYVGDDITSVMGIMNGTTNFMLTKMEKEGADYAEVLKEAQDLGFAEADPTADVEGHDVQAKIALLAKLAFGQDVALENVPCTGISKLSSADFSCAKTMGCTIKLVGTAKVIGSPASPSLAVYVSPVLAPLGGTLASAQGPGNVVVVGSKNLSESVYAGPGAGRYPTANSVVNDVVRLSRLGVEGTRNPFPIEKSWELEPDFEACFYARVPGVEHDGALASIGKKAKEGGVSINSFLRVSGSPISAGGSQVDYVLKTECCKLSKATKFMDSLRSEEWSNAAPILMPIL